MGTDPYDPASEEAKSNRATIDEQQREGSAQTDERPDPDDESILPFYAPYGWPPIVSRGTDEPADRSDRFGPDRPEGERVGRAEGWLDQGLIGVALVVGIVLLVFPEPTTSAIGFVLVTVALAAWLFRHTT